MLHRRRIARKHFQITHHVDRAVRNGIDILRLNCARVPGLGNNCWLALSQRISVKVARIVWIERAAILNDDVIHAECKDHPARNGVKFFIACFRPVSVRAQILVEVSAVKVNKIIRTLYDLLMDSPRRTFCLRPIRLAGIHPIHILAVDRIQMWNLLLEGVHIDERNENHRSGNLLCVDVLDKALDGNDRSVFGPMRTSNDGKHWTRFCAAYHDHGNLQCGIDPRRNINVASGRFARLGRCRAHGKIFLLGAHPEGEHRSE